MYVYVCVCTVFVIFRSLCFLCVVIKQVNKCLRISERKRRRRKKVKHRGRRKEGKKKVSKYFLTRNKTYRVHAYSYVYCK
ncbi:hypothetical protein F4809DRAFT_611925 [Biscogniauxia mediterranea]|nr:hypothetical protein F4809DRAFT_611925 [Biscogniauxia mediterranea]